MLQQYGTPAALWRGALAAGAMLLATTGAQSQTAPDEWAATVARGVEEGRVNVYSNAVPEQVERLIASFNEVHPDIRVSHTRGSGELAARVASEIEASNDGADVFIFSDPLWFAQNPDGTLPISSPSAAAYPDSGWFIKDHAAFVGFPPLGMLVWNTDYVPEGLSTYEELLKPELAGHIGTREQMTAVLAAYLDFLETELGPDYLPALGAQKPKFYVSAVPLVQALAAGEIWAGNVGVIGSLKELQDQGAPVAWAIPKPSGFANTWAAGVIRTSKRPDAARVFLDYMMSPEGQAALNGGEASASPLPGIPGALDLSDFAIMDPNKYTPEVREEWTRKFQAYFR